MKSVTGTIAAGTLLLVGAGVLLYARARSHVNDVALSSSPKAVTVVEARAGTYRPERHYVATLDPWVAADVGPQLIAAYADTVLVRPGAEVKRGQVLATLDCRESSATHRAVAMQARAIEAKQKAVANESARVNSLLDGGFVAPNEAEQKVATSESQLAELMATQAKLAGTALAVDDCILRAPFDGEVSRRMVDPGAFVRPGSSIISVIDRSTIRVSAEVPESDFPFVAPSSPVKIKILATGDEATGTISRRSPAASSSTRTVHFEIDLPDPERKIPVGATADLTIEVGKPEPATIVPGTAASIRADRATVFVVDGDHVKKVVVPVKGEVLGTLYCETALAPGTRVVTEGRSLLSDGDKVIARTETQPAPSAARPVNPESKQ
jgi:RND family efflux transporter MFP subunit